jgi:hypothetical protein
LISKNFPHQPNNFIPPEYKNVNFYQTDSEEETSSTFINQHKCSGFKTNSIINPSFITTLNAHFPNAQVQNIFLAKYGIIPTSSTTSNDFENSISS